MPRQFLVFTLSLLLSLTLCSQRISAQEQAPLPKPDFSGLSREQKEAIVICFSENESCHASLSHALSPPTYKNEYPEFIGALILGLVGGMILEYQIHH